MSGDAAVVTGVLCARGLGRLGRRCRVGVAGQAPGMKSSSRWRFNLSLGDGNDAVEAGCFG